MNAADHEPSPDDLQAMAYADGELSGAELAAFELRLAARPELARQVTQHLSLAVLARQSAPPEPMDYEWRRLERDGLQRILLGLGWTLAVGGVLLLCGWLVHGLLTSDMQLAVKIALCALLVGGLALFLATLRARLRTRPYDPYTEIQR
jgi:anti-sigma factor RsiW